MTAGAELPGVTERDDPERAAVARSLGLEVSRARYLRTLDRVRRCERTARLLGRLGPLARVAPVSARRSVEIASADARLVLVKLWTAGERYRRVLAAVDRDPDQVDPGAGRSPADFADLRRRLSDAPQRADESDYAAVAATMAAARRAIRTLLDARLDDCGAFVGVDPDRLARAAETAAEALTLEHEAREEALRRRHGEREADAEADYRTPVGNSDQVRPEALEAENVDPDLIASLADDDEAVDPDELARALGTDAATESDPDHDATTAEEVIGASFDIGAAEGDASEQVDEARASADEPADETERRRTTETDDASGFEFGAVPDEEARAEETDGDGTDPEH